MENFFLKKIKRVRERDMERIEKKKKNKEEKEKLIPFFNIFISIISRKNSIAFLKQVRWSPK